MTKASQFTYPLDDREWHHITYVPKHVWARLCPQIDGDGDEAIVEIIISQEAPDSTLSHDVAIQHIALTNSFQQLPEAGIEVKRAPEFVDRSITFRIVA